MPDTALNVQRARSLQALIYQDLPADQRTIGNLWLENQGTRAGWFVAVRWRGEIYRLRSLADWWSVRGGDPRK